MVTTLRDVARAAGVSPATASRALTHPELVAPGRRVLVERAAAALDYRPNRAARELAGGRTGNLAVVVPDIANPFFAGLVKGVQARARELGYGVFVADADDDPRLEAELVAQVGAQADGTILASPRMSDDEVARLPDDRPFVLVNRRHDAHASVVVDNTDGMRQAVRHLHALGHRRIGFAGGPAGSWSDARRRDGLEVAAHGLHRLEVVDLGAFPATTAGGTAAADVVAATGVTAVLAHNDLVALALLDRLRTRGIRTPEDVSVVGHDDTVAVLGSPRLTTVAVPLARLGRAAVDRLLDDDPGPDVPLPVELVVRASTAPATATAAAPSTAPATAPTREALS
ncbi:LacI family DNA-binding transcriptional regulator [Cellulomonas palmilytica]|uniref:LacI family DNA-binding transcriptional regulator n=1 Tax=Cellulomonas palmilytica TaxID=2608402 RepID=UPI001F27D153|nr:LacI family DNA-binding transcriptional regulator [Cellulomonas palmilytica]UJP40110.1 LacI family DNA-binding transcriptional regulator [Cellulomonas palmilytica]